MNQLRDAAEIFANKCNCGTLQAEVLFERLAELLNAGVGAASLLETINTHPAATTHPGDPLAVRRIMAANQIKAGKWN